VCLCEQRARYGKVNLNQFTRLTDNFRFGRIAGYRLSAYSYCLNTDSFSQLRSRFPGSEQNN